MGKFAAFKNSKSPLFRGSSKTPTQPSWPINGNRMFFLPSNRDALSQHIVFNMKRHGLMAFHPEFEILSTLRVEAPRNDRLFKIRRVGK